MYNITSVARTLIAHLPKTISIVLESLGKNHIAADWGYFRVIFFFFFYIENDIVCIHLNRLDDAILIRTHNIPSC